MTQLFRARLRPRLRRRAAAGRGRSAQGAARRRAVESRQDHGARAGRRLCDQPRAAQGRARRQPAAGAGDGLHRHVRAPSSASRSRRSMLAMSRRDSRSRSPSSICPARSIPARSRACCRRSQPARCRPRVCAVQPKAIQAAPFVVRVKLDDAELADSLPAGSTGDGRDLHRSRQGRSRHPQGAAAADRDPNYVNPF